MVEALMNLDEGPSEYGPGFLLAEKGQKLLIIEEIDNVEEWGSRKNYKYVCQDLEKKYDSFYVKDNEVKLIGIQK